MQDLNESGTLTELEKEEKNHLVDSILSRGEICLLHGDISGLDLFETSSKLDPQNPALFFRQGLALYEYGCEEGKGKTLFLANKKFKAATALLSTDFFTWHAWGNSLFTLGTAYEENRYFVEAKEKYSQALKLATQATQDEQSELYWDYANAWAQIGACSGEAIDLKLALNAYQKSSELNDSLPPDFWVDYGKASLSLAQLINDIRLFVKAINTLRHAITLEPSHAEAWSTLAHCLTLLYAQSHEDDHFSQACECFAAATRLEPHEGSLFLSWAQFLLEGGIKTKKVKRLHASIEKCRCALSCGYDLTSVMAIWTQALAHIGLWSDSLDLIFEAENKIDALVDKDPNDPNLWHSNGICLHALGSYFKDADYYYQAIEKFQEGLSIDRSLTTLWHSMAKSYAAIAQIDDSADAFEKAYRFFYKTLKLQNSSSTLSDFAMCLSSWGELNNQQKWLEEAIYYFEQALSIQKNAVYVHPDWLFHYATTLDLLGDFHDEDTYYLRTIEILSHVLMIDPDYPNIHHRLALAFSHMGELASSCECFYKASHHFRLACARDEENDQVILDWALSLINLAEHMHDRQDADATYRDAEYKLIKAARLGNIQAYYQLGCLCALLGQYDRALRFLEKADHYDALPPIDEILEDEWLDNIKHLSEFQSFIARLESRPHHVSDEG